MVLLCVLIISSDIFSETEGMTWVNFKNKDQNTITMLVGIFCGVFLVVVAVSVAVCAIKRRKPEKQPKKRIILLSPVRNCSDVQVS